MNIFYLNGSLYPGFAFSPKLGADDSLLVVVTLLSLSLFSFSLVPSFFINGSPAVVDSYASIKLLFWLYTISFEKLGNTYLLFYISAFGMLTKSCRWLVFSNTSLFFGTAAAEDTLISGTFYFCDDV